MMRSRGGYRYRKPVCVGHVGGAAWATARNVAGAVVRGGNRWAWIADDGCILVCESDRQIPDGCVRIGCYASGAAAFHVEQDVRVAVREFAELAIIERAAA